MDLEVVIPVPVDGRKVLFTNLSDQIKMTIKTMVYTVSIPFFP